MDQTVHEIALSKHTLVLGGAASGKSAVAEGRVLATGLNPIYVATAQAYDTEMQDKVALHRAQRGGKWTTVEQPINIAPTLAKATPLDAVLIDCATLWLTNLMLSDTDISTAEASLMQALANCQSPVTIVSNEVGQGIVPENAMARRFRTIQGRFNQRMAAAVGTVLFVTAGLPQTLTGTP
jgi:adenosylcobinamide kinase/adenosylcobinamide-phosphate guanylyltransferase